MFKSGEIYNVMESFEKITSGRFDKEAKELWKRGIYYQSGEVNDSFKMYLNGYAAGKCNERLGCYSQAA